MGKKDTSIKAYKFLRAKAESGKPFTVQDLCAASGWSESSVTTYLSKKLGDLVVRSSGQITAKREVLNLSEEQFLSHMTQVKKVFTDYTRQKFEHLLTYEFLLPLTREDKLRQALDALFFTDTIRKRIQEIGLTNLESVIPRSGLQDDAYIASVIESANKIAGGYSISHASGRFRANKLLSRMEAGQLLAGDGRYLVDETVAVVRFLIPLEAGRMSYGPSFNEMLEAIVKVEPTDKDALDAELNAHRMLFFQLFVEAIVRTVIGEDEVWLIETAPGSRRLFKWSRSDS